MSVHPRRSAFFAAVATAAGLSGGFAFAGWTRRYIVLGIDRIVVDLTPAPVVNATIRTLGERGHLLHVALSLAIAAALLGGLAFGVLVIGQHFDLPPLIGALGATVVAAVLSLVLTGAAAPSLVLAASLGAVVAIGEYALAAPVRGPDAADGDRRRAVGLVSAAVAYAGLSLAIGSTATRRSRAIEAEPLPERETIDDLLAEAAATDLEIDGVEPPVSPIGSFYTVDINSAPPVLDEAEWGLTIRGAVEEPVALDYDQLRAQPVEHRYEALRCIGEDLNGEQMDTALWTGTPLGPLLERANPGGEYVELHAADGYVATFSRPYLEYGLVAYGMNGQVLPREHGYPARILMPGSWGKLNVKWVTDVVFVEEPTEGYWEQRGWNSEAPITTVAKLHAVNDLGDGSIEVGGHAYAGTRGIDRVEVSTDGGETWTDAELAEPLPGRDVTRQWRHRYAADDTHEVVVRAVDGTGQLQTEQPRDQFPSGAAGWVRRTVER